MLYIWSLYASGAGIVHYRALRSPDFYQSTYWLGTMRSGRGGCPGIAWCCTYAICLFLVCSSLLKFFAVTIFRGAIPKSPKSYLAKKYRLRLVTFEWYSNKSRRLQNLIGRAFQALMRNHYWCLSSIHNHYKFPCFPLIWSKRKVVLYLVKV